MKSLPINPLKLPTTDSRNGEEYNPLNPTYHLDADSIIHQNVLMLDNATKILNKVISDIKIIRENYYKTAPHQRLPLDEKLNNLELKKVDYQNNLDDCKESYNQAIALINN